MSGGRDHAVKSQSYAHRRKLCSLVDKGKLIRNAANQVAEYHQVFKHGVCDRCDSAAIAVLHWRNHLPGGIGYLLDWTGLDWTELS